MNARFSKPLIILGLAGLAAGFYGLIEALLEGTHATNLGSYTPWGLGVALYLLFLGLSAGGLLISSMIYIFGMKEMARLNALATLAALVCEVCAGIAIALDLGHWERMYRFVISPSLTSPMWWMFLFFNAMALVYTLKAWAIYSGNEALSRVWSLVSIPVSLIFYGINGYFFSVLTSRPVWSGPLTPVWFVVAALLSGGALLAALAWFSQRDGQATLKTGRAVLLLLVIFVLLEGLHVTVGYQGGRTEVVRALDSLLGGPGWWSFWLLHLAVGLVLPLLLLFSCKDSPPAVAWAGVLVVVGFLGFRYAYVVSAQSVPFLPGLDLAWQHARLSLTYCPSLGEWLLCLWVVSLGVLLYALGARYMPAADGGQGGEQHV
jgi:molybdopterin-containing oxidoreductase family membrane subunit